MAFQVGVHPKSRKRIEYPKRAVFYLILIIYAIITATPFVWALLTSFKTLPESAHYPPTFLPAHWTTSAWHTVFANAQFPRWFFNSVVVAALVTIGNLFFDSLGGYAFARLKFPGREIIFWMVLGTLMVPVAMTLVPTYVILVKMPGGSWINTYQGLTVPFMVSAFGLFFMRQFFNSIPAEIEDAGRVDGLSPFGLYRYIALPLSRPALATLAVLTFQGSWDSFMMPRFIASTPNMFTLPVGLANYSFAYLNYWPEMMAGSLVVIIPILIIFVFVQRYFIEGIASTGVKG